MKSSKNHIKSSAILAILLVMLTACQPKSAPASDPSSKTSPTPSASLEEGPDPLGQQPEPIYLTLKEHFKPVPKPGPSDWLANHEEAGQTYESYRASHPNRPSQQRNKIYLLPLEAFDDEAPPLDFLKRYTEVFFGLEVVLLEPLSESNFTSRTNGFHPVRQLLTKDILDYLKQELSDDAYCLLGITTRDLYPSEKWNYVFGIASLSERVGVYSFARYDPEFFGKERPSNWRRKMLERSCKVLSHETAHMAGMSHCIHYDCLMNGSNHLAELDSQNSFLCPVCLRKLKFATGLDLMERYEKLQELYSETGLQTQKDWIDDVLD